MIKIKGLIYRYLGIFFATKEEYDYVQSKEFWNSFIEIYESPENDMSPSQIQGLLIGSWECEFGFFRPMSRFAFRNPRFFFSIIAWFHILFVMIKWDFKFLVAKLKKK